LIDPAKADHTVCKPTETPIDCELRITKPSIALIMIGTNDLKENNIAVFSANLHRILTIVENHDVIPVLSTIPYRRDDPALQGRVPAYNQAIVQVATARSEPLWNYWLAVNSLPANGVSIDGIHPSIPGDHETAIFDSSHLQFGFTMRNLTALQVLQSLMAVLK
jgi:hypothetical protein